MNLVNDTKFWWDKYFEWRRDKTVYHYLSRAKDNEGRDKKQIIFWENKSKGTYSRVYKECYDENGKKIALKVLNNDDIHSEIELFAEYKIHKTLYDKYIEAGLEPKCVKPIWLRKVKINGGHYQLGLGMELFNETLATHIIINKETDETRQWKKEILTEIKRLNTEWKFYHRDIHINNIGLTENSWCFFDFGMSRFDTLSPYNEGGICFYQENVIPSNSQDERILRFSWAEFGDDDKEYIEKEQRKMVTSDPTIWYKNMPVVFKNHPKSENGYFIWIEEDGKLLIELDIKNTEGAIQCALKREDVLPDMIYDHIVYYFPTLD